MAAAAPTPAELQALILQLQSQVTTLTSGTPPAGPAPAAVIFADTPQSLYTNDLINYSTKLDLASMSKDSRLSTTRHSPMVLG